MRYFAFGEKHKFYLSEIKILMKIFESMKDEIMWEISGSTLHDKCTEKLNQRNRVDLEKLSLAQPVKNSPLCIESAGLLPCTNQLASGPYPKPDKCNPYFQNLF
jgi:hypothetical protein